MTYITDTERRTREIVGDITDREVHSQKAKVGTLLRLNRVFEEMKIPYGSHKIPTKVVKSVEKKATAAQEAAAVKAATTEVGPQKRKALPVFKAGGKKKKQAPASRTARSFDAGEKEDEDEEVGKKMEEEVTETGGRGSSSVATTSPAHQASRSADRSVPESTEVTAPVSIAEATAAETVVIPLPAVLGDDSSKSEDSPPPRGGLPRQHSSAPAEKAVGDVEETSQPPIQARLSCPSLSWPHWRRCIKMLML